MDGGCAHFSKLFYEEGEKLLFSTKKPKKKSSNTIWPCSSFHAFMAKHFTGVRRTCTGIQHTALLCTLDGQACAAFEAHSNHAETVQPCHCPKDCNDPMHSMYSTIQRHTCMPAMGSFSVALQAKFIQSYNSKNEQCS